MNLNPWGCTGCLYEFEYMEKTHHKINTYSNKMNAYKDFHAFTCISMIKTCIEDLVLENKNAKSQVISIKSKLIFNVSY